MAESRSLRNEILEPQEPPRRENIPRLLQDGIQLQLTEDQEKEIVDMVRDDFQAAEEAREATSGNWGNSQEGTARTWEAKFTDLINLYENQHPPRSEKWMSNTSLRMAMSLVELLFAKIFPAVWNEDSIRWRPVEPTDQEKVDRIHKFMKWAVNIHINAKKLRLIIKQAVKNTIKLGNCILKDAWFVKRENRGEVEQIPITDENGMALLDEGGNPQTAPQIKLETIEYPEVEFIPLEKFYVQPGQTDLQKEPVIHRQDFFFSDLERMETEGKISNVQDLVKMKIDSKIVSDLQIATNEAQRLADDISRKRRHFHMDVLEWYGEYDPIVNEQGEKVGFPAECIFLVDRTTWTYLSGMYLSTVSKRNKRPFNKLGFILRENAFYWIGVLEQARPLVKEMDVIVRQMIDSNTLSVMRWGFYDPSGDYEPETHIIKPRAMYPVSDPQRNVFFPDITIPTERLLNAIKLLMEFVERLTATSATVFGKDPEFVGGPGTATRTQAIVSASNERFAIPVENIRDGLADVLSNILCQYQMNIPPGLEKRVLGEKGQKIFKEGELTKASITAELDAYLLPSATFGNKDAELQIANWVYQNLLINPLVATSMERVWKTSAVPLKAMGLDPVQFLGPEPFTKPTNNPDDENTMLREGSEIQPEPQENHLFHLLRHNAVKQDPEFQTWLPEAVALLDAHIQATQEMMQQILQVTLENVRKGGIPGAGGQGQAGATQGPRAVAAEPGKSGAAVGGAESPLTGQGEGTTSAVA